MADQSYKPIEEVVGIPQTANSVPGAAVQTWKDVKLAGYSVERIEAYQRVVNAAAGLQNAGASFQESRGRLHLASYQARMMEENPELFLGNLSQLGGAHPSLPAPPVSAREVEDEKTALRRRLAELSDE